MLHDAGIAEIYRVERDESSPPPAPTWLAKKAWQPFGEMTVGVTRFYAAASAGKTVSRVIELWRDASISVRDICKIEDQYYLIQQVSHTVDDDGIPITRLTLEETDGSAWEGNVDASD